MSAATATTAGRQDGNRVLRRLCGCGRNEPSRMSKTRPAALVQGVARPATRGTMAVQVRPRRSSSHRATSNGARCRMPSRRRSIVRRHQAPRDVRRCRRLRWRPAPGRRPPHTTGRRRGRRGTASASRLWLAHELPRNSESRVLAMGLCGLRRYSAVRFLVSYADPAVAPGGVPPHGSRRSGQQLPLHGPVRSGRSSTSATDALWTRVRTGPGGRPPGTISRGTAGARARSRPWPGPAT